MFFWQDRFLALSDTSPSFYLRGRRKLSHSINAELDHVTILGFRGANSTSAAPDLGLRMSFALANGIVVGGTMRPLPSAVA